MYQHVNGMSIAMAINLSICGCKLLRLGEPAKQPACGLHETSIKEICVAEKLLSNYTFFQPISYRSDDPRTPTPQGPPTRLSGGARECPHCRYR